MTGVRPKKHLGQHFLTDKATAKRIADTLMLEGVDSLLEVGPGTGMLTGFLLEKGVPDFRVIEIDNESVEYLNSAYPELVIIKGDFLKYDLNANFESKVAIIGNFPFNISSQIFFKVLENRDKVSQLAGMIQKEVAERIVAGPGSKTYGILSVLLKYYYNIEYLFTVPPDVFKPRPKVEAAVIRMSRNDSTGPACDEKLLKRVVKATFNHRRKMIRNSIRSAFDIGEEQMNLFKLRPEQIDLDDFVNLTNWVEEVLNKK